jgi:hypothetical protein
MIFQGHTRLKTHYCRFFHDKDAILCVNISLSYHRMPNPIEDKRRNQTTNRTFRAAIPLRAGFSVFADANASVLRRQFASREDVTEIPSDIQ